MVDAIPNISEQPQECSRCTFPIPPMERHYLLAGWRVCERCLWPGEHPAKGNTNQ